jgi:hypothetical protein
VLEILGAPTQRQQATERRERASAAELAHYRQMRLAEPGEGPQSGEPALVRRVRGWLLSLER